MDNDSTENPELPGRRMARRGSEPAAQRPDLPPQDSAPVDIDPATASAEEDDEARLPEVPELHDAFAKATPLVLALAAV